MELRELLSGEIETVSAETTVIDAAIQMQDAGVGSLAVMTGDEFSGIFTERDILRMVAAGEDPASETVISWMTMYPDAFLPDMDVKEAADWMLAAGYRHLPVVDAGRLVGMASIKDILWALTGDTVR
ncbi:MAG TPA: CBS domain-containing protein [Acidimicrobiia bacterium]|nr:CBS domain-containing protein [Acidimicrobiia bacterium]